MERSIIKLEETEQDCLINVCKEVKHISALDRSNDKQGLDEVRLTKVEGLKYVDTSWKRGHQVQLDGFGKKEARDIDKLSVDKRDTTVLNSGEAQKRTRRVKDVTQLQTYAKRAKGIIQTYEVGESDRKEGRDSAVGKGQSTKLKGATNLNSQSSVDGDHQPFEGSHSDPGSCSGHLKNAGNLSDSQELVIGCCPPGSLCHDEDSKMETELLLENKMLSSSDEESDEEVLTVNKKGEPEEHCAPMVIAKLKGLVEKYVPVHKVWRMVTRRVRYKICQNLQNSIDSGEKINTRWIITEASKAHHSAQHKAKNILWKEHCESLQKAGKKAVRKTAQKAVPARALKHSG